MQPVISAKDFVLIWVTGNDMVFREKSYTVNDSHISRRYTIRWGDGRWRGWISEFNINTEHDVPEYLIFTLWLCAYRAEFTPLWS